MAGDESEQIENREARGASAPLGALWRRQYPYREIHGLREAKGQFDDGIDATFVIARRKFDPVEEASLS